MIKSITEVYDTAINDERKRITDRLELEIEELKQYGRTELWGLHKAMLIVNEQREEDNEHLLQKSLLRHSLMLGLHRIVWAINRRTSMGYLCRSNGLWSNNVCDDLWIEEL